MKAGAEASRATLAGAAAARPARVLAMMVLVIILKAIWLCGVEVILGRFGFTLLDIEVFVML